MLFGKIFFSNALGSILYLLGAAALADPWQADLKTGGVVRIDSQTYKPTLYYNGGSTPLWDGVHETLDGDVIIVRSGVAVPDESMINTWSRSAPGRQAGQVAVCERLVRKACGLSDECSSATACDLARQLLRMRRDEERQVAHAHKKVAAEQCRKALVDDAMFPVCDLSAASTVTPCGQLVAQVCGVARQCARAQSCDLATQLRDMERQELLDIAVPEAEAVTESGKQCREAMKNRFFSACMD